MGLAHLVPVLLICVIAGCARRRVAVPALPPAPVADSQPTVDSPQPPPTRREVAILFSSAPEYAEVASQLRKLLPSNSYRLILADVDAEDSQGALAGLRGKPGLFIVAVGLPAARIARDQFKTPVVFAQVFNYQELLVEGRAIRGVSAMPPFDLQVQDWKKLDPKLRHVGLIISERHPELIREAESAARASEVTIEHRISHSDQETLYLFKRLAPQIDGLWLVPDDQILSPAVLRETLSYAVSHGVRVCVFSDALLSWGAVLSARPTPVDIARTVRGVLEAMIAGDTDGVPTLTPLSEFVFRVNGEVAGRLGLSRPPREAWLVRDNP